MPAAALLLTLASAWLHAGWNVLLGRAKDTEAFTAVALALGVLAFAPVAAATWDVRAQAVPYVVASSTVELAFFVLLAAAYRRSEVSLVYPIARGLAPVLVLAFGVAVLGTAAPPGRIAGVLLVGIGIVLVRGLRRAADARGIALAVAIAACIATYTLIDKEGLRYAHPIPYLELVLAVPTAAYLAGVAAVRGRPALRRELGVPAALVGVGLFGAYTLVLAALRLAAAAPVAAVRETGVVIATALAAVVLRERVGPVRMAGAVLVVAGIAALAVS